MSLRRLLVAGLLCAVLFSPTASQAGALIPARAVLVAYGSLAMFTTEGSAQAHCPSDVVVWLNVSTGIWHEKGMRWYGRTKHGAYVCRKEAAAAGYRDTLNGQ